MICNRSACSQFALIVAAIFIPAGAFADFNPIERASVTSAEAQVDAPSDSPGISTNSSGRYIAFASTGDLTSLSNAGRSNIFLRDNTSGTTTLITDDDTNTPSNGGSFTPAISADGTKIVFASDATDLISPADTNGFTDIYLYNSGTTTILSNRDGALASNGDSGTPAISDDGTVVAFASLGFAMDSDGAVVDTDDGFSDIYLLTVGSTDLELISTASGGANANGSSFSPSLSSTGRYVAFASAATNLNISGGDTNDGVIDIYRYDSNDGSVVKVSHDTTNGAVSSDCFGPVISNDGRYVAFYSAANDIVTGTSSNTALQVYLWDANSGTIVLLSRADGANGTVGNGDSSSPSMNSDAQFVVFESAATNLVTGDSNAASDIFARNTTGLTTTRISVTETGSQSNAASSQVVINDNGQFVAYASVASTLVVPDFFSQSDIYRADMQCLLAPTGVVPGDEDSDSTDDCADDCPQDATKIAAGQCGCGAADTDTDTDGTADCTDECDSDAAKTTAGDCGCGVADSDANGNGNADCNDPDLSTVPGKPTTEIIKKCNKDQINLRVTVAANNYEDNVRFKFILRRDGQIVKTIKSTSGQAVFKNLDSGTYKVSTAVELPEGTFPGNQFSQESAKKKVTIKSGLCG